MTDSNNEFNLPPSSWFILTVPCNGAVGEALKDVNGELDVRVGREQAARPTPFNTVKLSNKE